MRVNSLVIVMGSMLIAGCTTLGPDYQAPELLQTQMQWTEATQKYAIANNMQSLQWWQSFEDEQLSELLIKGSTGNLDVREAFLRTQEAKALYRVEESRGQAEFSLDALGNRSLTSENGQIPLGQIPGAQTEGYFFNMGMAATWELDVFGRVKRAIEAADAKVEIAQSSYEGLLLTIQADIASTYFEIQQQNLQVEYLQQRIELRQKSLQMTAKRTLAGAESFFQVALERSAFEELKSQLPSLIARKNTAMNRLGILVGMSSHEINEYFVIPSPLSLPRTMVPVGLPSDLLLRRPDIRIAERSLAAETAEIGIAKADRFPRFSLTGDLSLESTDFSELFSDDSLAWSLGGLLNFTIPVLGGERLDQQVLIAESEAHRAKLRYENTVLKAIEEVESALVNYVESKKALDALYLSVKEQTKAVSYAKLRYESGHSKLSEYLQQQEQLQVSKSGLVAQNTMVAMSVINLYRALGGSPTNVHEPNEQS